jgi:hypothetical protein
MEDPAFRRVRSQSSFGGAPGDFRADTLYHESHGKSSFAKRIFETMNGLYFVFSTFFGRCRSFFIRMGTFRQKKFGYASRMKETGETHAKIIVFESRFHSCVLNGLWI